MTKPGFPACAAILAGGVGSRLRTIVGDRPKVLAPVHGRPFITYLLDQLAAASVEEIVLLTGYQARQVRATLGESYAGVRLQYSEEPFALGTAGALRWALPRLSTDTVLVLNGDSYCEVALPDFCAFHAQSAAEVSLVLTQTTDASRFGRVYIDESGWVKGFAEKTALYGSAWINAGIYLLERSLIAKLPLGCPRSLEHEVLPTWVERGRCAGFPCAGRFLDIGTPEAYAEAEPFFALALDPA